MNSNGNRKGKLFLFPKPLALQQKLYSNEYKIIDSIHNDLIVKDFPLYVIRDEDHLRALFPFELGLYEYLVHWECSSNELNKLPDLFGKELLTITGAIDCALRDEILIQVIKLIRADTKKLKALTFFGICPSIKVYKSPH